MKAWAIKKKFGGLTYETMNGENCEIPKEGDNVPTLYLSWKQAKNSCNFGYLPVEVDISIAKKEKVK